MGSVGCFGQKENIKRQSLGYYSQFEAAGFTKEMKKEGEITTYTFTKVISGKTYQFIGNWQENKKTRGTFTLMFSEL